MLTTARAAPRVLDHLGDDLIARAYAKSTLASYARRWSHFVRFAEDLGDRSSPPVSEQLIRRYAAQLYADGLAASSIRSAVSIIGWKHSLLGFPDPSKGLAVKKLLLGIAKSAPGKKIVSPIGITLLNVLLTLVNSLSLSAYNKQLLKAILVLGYHGVLRVGEMVKSSHENHCILFKNTGFSCEGNYHFTLQSFKHGKGPIQLTLTLAKGQVHCPIKR